MVKKRLEKSISSLMAGMMITAFMGSSTVFAESGQVISSENITLEAKDRVSVHDPSIVKDGDTYYVFGSHIEAAKSTDLQSWTKFTNGYTTPNNVLFGDLSKNLAGSFKWAGENDSDSKGGFSVWAPNVIWNEQYVNDDGTKGAYMMYYCTSSTYKRSAIGYAISKDDINGPYTYVDTVMYSGFTKDDAYDANSTINTNYLNTNIKDLMDKDVISEANPSWFSSNGGYNTSYAPNAIDPELFFDEDGTLWMSYGSWSGGVYILKIDPKTGEAIYPGKDSNMGTSNHTDRYFGTRISGGYTKSGEGADIVYDKETGYYYLYVTYAGLAAKGGYNIRMFRSKNPDGPYLDAAGNNAVLTGNVDNNYAGIKLIGNYKFDCNRVGYRAAGHNSSFIDSDGQMYLVYHTRFDAGTEYHEVRVHQMFINEEGWPVVAPYENSGDKISETGYSKEEVVGRYQFINHGNDSSSAMLSTLNIQLNEDCTVSGDVTGTWSMKDGSYFMNIVIGGVTYKGVFFKQQDESEVDSKIMTFTAVGSNNKCVWGSKLDLVDSKAIEYAASDLSVKIPSITKSNLTLPTVGAYDTAISWTSNNPTVLSNEGIVNRITDDVTVTLTAKITKGQAALNKAFNVVVSGKLEKLDVEPTFKYDFESVNEANEVVNSGSKAGNASLKGSASLIADEDRGQVLSIISKKTDKKVNYLALPENTFDGITNEGYTVSMWVNLDKKDANYWEHSALFEANAGGQDKYPVTRISANLFGRINANGKWADATEISRPLQGNVWENVIYTVSPKGIVVYVDGTESARADVDITECFKDNFLANMKDVRFGSGNIWGDADIANAKFDDVSVFNTALSYKQVEALYNEGLPVEEPQVPVITVEKEELTLEIGESQKLNVTVEPLDTVLTFVSSDENIATVSEEGVVSAKAAGEASITISAGDVSKVVKLKVGDKVIVPVPPVITVEKDEISVEVGQSQKLNVTVEPLDTALTFASSDENIATVSTDGVILAKAAGEVSITISAGDVSKVVKVTIKNKPSDEVVTEPENPEQPTNPENPGQPQNPQTPAQPETPVVTEPTIEVEVKPETSVSTNTNTTTSNASTDVAKEVKNSDTKGKGLPKTGEAVSTTMVLTAALGSMAAGIRLRRKSKDN